MARLSASKPRRWREKLERPSKKPQRWSKKPRPPSKKLGRSSKKAQHRSKKLGRPSKKLQRPSKKARPSGKKAQCSSKKAQPSASEVRLSASKAETLPSGRTLFRPTVVCLPPTVHFGTTVGNQTLTVLIEQTHRPLRRAALSRLKLLAALSRESDPPAARV